MKRQALLVVLAMAFSVSSFATGKQPSGLQSQPKGSKQADCLFPSRVSLEKTKWILPSQEPAATKNSATAKRATI